MSIRVTNVERGVRSRDGFAFMRRFCDRFIDRMVSYNAAIPEDYWPFQYGERALIGFLAAGIWSCRGGICIEEYSVDRKPRIAEDPRESYVGRGDLYFKVGEEQGNVEAKLWNIGVSEPPERSRVRKFIGPKWKSIKQEAITPEVGRGPGRYGALFLRPYLGQSRDLDLYQRNLNLLLRSVWDETKPDVLAWWCPVEDVLKAGDSYDAAAGIILLIKTAK